jgi:dCMP deaminase
MNKEATSKRSRAGSEVEVNSKPASNKVKKRSDPLCWDDYFMSVAFLSSMRSKDPNTQVGACIVNGEKRIVGIGYNGFPRGCDDDELPWARHSESGNELETKYPYVCHAEVNAILNKNSADVQGCSLYVGLFPCNECAKMIIQSGIREVVFLSDKYKNSNSMIASRKLLGMAKVTTRQHTPKGEEVVIKFPVENTP